jgi:hypothetical protein
MGKENVINAGNGSVGAWTIQDSTITIINNNGTPLTPEEIRQIETCYLQRLVRDCGGLDWLDTIQYQDEKSLKVTLDAVYTPLMTELRQVQEHDPGVEGRGNQAPLLGVVEAVNNESQLVLIGEPGSGKSAFVNFLSLCMASEALEPNSSNRAQPGLDRLTEPLPDYEGKPEEKQQPWQHGVLIPLRIILRDFAASGFFQNPLKKEMQATCSPLSSMTWPPRDVQTICPCSRRASSRKQCSFSLTDLTRWTRSVNAACGCSTASRAFGTPLPATVFWLPAVPMPMTGKSTA